ncbi:MAG TPA: NAD(P)/FAD-dependent oxidoreductase [Candidatus Paceibacterota bacterium]
MVKEVVIVGGGFGGVRVAQRLARRMSGVHITLIDKERYHTFHPELYEVATADLPETFGHLPLEFRELRSSASYPLIDIFRNDVNVTVVHGAVSGIDFKNQKALLEHGATYPYDALVLAVGSETNYFNIPGLSPRALPLKTLWNALSIRNALDEAFTRAPKRHRIAIVIGGGGFTGCEFAGELAFFVKKLEAEHGREHNFTDIVIVEASSAVMGGASTWIQRKAQRRLTSLGIRLMLERPIAGVQDSSLVLKDGTTVSFDLLVWTAGVRASGFTKTCAEVSLQKNFCLCVDQYLRTLPYENVFSVGDATYCVDDATGTSYPMTATIALKEAEIAARNIERMFGKKPLITFSYTPPGFIVPLGGKYALFDSRWIKISGVLAWMLKHMVALHYWVGLIGLRRGYKVWRSGMKIFVRND